MKKRKKQKAEKVKNGIDLGTPESRKHGSAEIETRLSPDGKLVRAARVQAQTPLDVYRKRRLITRSQFDAGQRLYAEWYKAGRQPVLCFSYLQRTSRGSGEAAEAKETARKAYTSALRSLDGIGASVAVSVCLCGEWACDWASVAGLNPRKGIDYLRGALDGLKQHYSNA